MINEGFLTYIEEALEEYKEYQKKEKFKKFTFQEFLLMVLVWKTETVIEALEEKGGH